MITSTLRSYIEQCFVSYRLRVTDRFDYPYAFSDRITIPDGKVFSKYMKIDLTSDALELPCIYKRAIEKALSYNAINTENPITTLYIPLYYLKEDSAISRSSAPLLKQFFWNYVPSCNLIKKSSVNGTYLGGAGTILYEDYTPLIMYTIQVQKITNPIPIASKGKYKPLRAILRINPIVYERDDLLTKYIKSKLLAGTLELRNYDCAIRDPFNIFAATTFKYDFKVIIEDFSNFFESPKLPDSTFSSDKVNEYLYLNSEAITTSMGITNEES